MKGISLSPHNESFVSKYKNKKVTIYDTTLRDGEQMPGVSFSAEQKVEIAELLADIGVPQIEAGFPAVSENEKKAVKKITKLNTGSEILALSRLSKKDIDAAIDCDVNMTMLFVASSDIHLEHKLKMTREDVKARVVDAIEYAKSHGIKFSFSTEDSTRTDPAFLLELSKLGKEMGACRIGITDTTGCILPEPLGNLVDGMVEVVGTPLSVHLHDDFGLALANALSALENGATDFAVTVNGIGERAGNLALEKLVAALEFAYGVETGIDTTRLKEVCEKVTKNAGLPLSRNRPWVGENVFRHESGIHVAAIMSEPHTYECVLPEKVGASREILLGKHSGGAVVRGLLAEMQIRPNDALVSKILAKVKAGGESNGSVKPEEFEQMVRAAMEESDVTY